MARRGDQWLAQGVDFDLAAQGPSDTQALAAFIRILRAHYQRDISLGRKPLEGLPSPPATYVDEWERIVQTHNDSRVIPAEDGDDMPPAYILEAIANKGSDFGLGQ